MTKKVLITGVAGGIGLETAKLFHAKGWEVIGTDIKAMKDVLPINFIQGDISDEANNKIIFNSINGKLDALVNNAAIQLFRSLQEISIQDWDHVFRSNLYPAFFIARQAVEIMKKDKSSIVNVCSIHALATSMNMSSYAASKGALLALTRSLAIDLAPIGIRVNAVLPGAIDTPMLRQSIKRFCTSPEEEKQMLKNVESRTPLKRIGLPEEVAKSIYFLADNEQSSFITGSSLVVDGGAYSHLSTE
ncbi:SDR family oxidoreductase [Caldithrix abyssi]|nr:SDR family oxidoreductase [Caldithrix abyssi]